MTINFTTNAIQDAIIAYKTNKHNAGLSAGDTPLTQAQFVQQTIATMFSDWRAEYQTDRLDALRQKFLEASEAKRAQIESAAQ